MPPKTSYLRRRISGVFAPMAICIIGCIALMLQGQMALCFLGLWLCLQIQSENGHEAILVNSISTGHILEVLRYSKNGQIDEDIHIPFILQEGFLKQFCPRVANGT